AICLDLLQDKDEVRKLQCSHVFHVSCIDPWYERQRFDCPLCKSVYVVRPSACLEDCK
ncbi:hypothetical protein GE09DRAFT_981527, partial [Coniochaeta sp. 2T2.1]